MSQLRLTWDEPESYHALDFIVAPPNAVASRYLEIWPKPGETHATMLVGPASSGKTHLAHNWAARNHAVFLDASLLGKQPSADLCGTAHAAVLEDIHRIQDEAALFHLLRYAETHASFLLLTAQSPARQLSFTLPDLRSRLLAMPEIALEAADDDMLRLFIRKSFADRQMRISDEVVDYMIRHNERSFAAARALIERMEKSASPSGKITVKWVKSLLQNPREYGQ